MFTRKKAKECDRSCPTTVPWKRNEFLYWKGLRCLGHITYVTRGNQVYTESSKYAKV
jgi:hypothetical protein